MPSLSCYMWDLVPWPGIELRALLGVWSLSHWTTRDVPAVLFITETSGEEQQEPEQFQRSGLISRGWETMLNFQSGRGWLMAREVWARKSQESNQLRLKALGQWGSKCIFAQSCLVHHRPRVLKGFRDRKVSLTPPIPPSHVYTHHPNVSTWPASRE